MKNVCITAAFLLASPALAEEAKPIKEPTPAEWKIQVAQLQERLAQAQAQVRAYAVLHGEAVDRLTVCAASGKK